MLRYHGLDPDGQIAFLNAVRPHLEQGLRVQDWHIFEKYRWLARYFNRIAGEFGQMPIQVPAMLDMRREYLHAELLKTENEKSRLTEKASALKNEITKLQIGSSKLDAAIKSGVRPNE